MNAERRTRYFTLLLLLSCLIVNAQARPKPETVKQWQSRKYGMFIHFGLFSTLGGVWNGKQYSGNYSEQIQSDAHIPEGEYEALAAKFNPTQWDAEAIVKLAEDAGMKFIVITAKHHDGFNMFATKQRISILCRRALPERCDPEPGRGLQEARYGVWRLLLND